MSYFFTSHLHASPVESSLASEQVQLDAHDVDTMLLLGQLIQRLKHCVTGEQAGRQTEVAANARYEA
jgi:hypothetical protein